MTNVIYTGSFKYVAPIFWIRSKKTRELPSPLPLRLTDNPTITGKDDPTISCNHLMVKFGVFAGLENP